METYTTLEELKKLLRLQEPVVTDLIVRVIPRRGRPASFAHGSEIDNILEEFPRASRISDDESVPGGPYRVVTVSTRND